jgi:bifunctional non-homologous end joining protein LigD
LLFAGSKSYNEAADMEKQKKYVVQKHRKQSDPVHWDLMMENGTVLETYRLAAPPEKWGEKVIEAVKIFDHPLKFLSYEGTVNKGKGRVEIADCGTYCLIKRNKNQQQVSFSGEILKGEFQLCLIKEDKWAISCV